MGGKTSIKTEIALHCTALHVNRIGLGEPIHTSRLKETKARLRPKRRAAPARPARRDLTTVASRVLRCWVSRGASLRRHAEGAARRRERTAEKRPRERSAMPPVGGGGGRRPATASLTAGQREDRNQPDQPPSPSPHPCSTGRYFRRR